MRKDEVKTSNLRPFPAITFSPTFDRHMAEGDQSGQSHTGLHLIDNFRKGATQALPGVRLTAADIVANTTLTGRFTAPARAATVRIIEVDLRARTFRAAVSIYGTEKVSSFFPLGTTVDKAKDYVRAAWNDHCTYGTVAHGGRDVDIYSQMRAAFGLNWVGQATMGAQAIWVGASLNGSLVTAFPAVNNKFVRGG